MQAIRITAKQTRKGHEEEFAELWRELEERYSDQPVMADGSELWSDPTSPAKKLWPLAWL